MTATPTREAAANGLFPCLLAIGLPLVAGLVLGGDSSWDLRNYHLYDAHAWWTGRDASDIAAAQQQTWHNPTLDLPLYLLVRAGATARALTLWLVLPAMLLLWSLSRLHARLSDAPPTRWAQLALAVLALSGAGVGGTLGLSSNDVFVAAGLLLALSLSIDAQDGATLRNWALAGLVAGMTAGLKLSAAYACIALACTVLPSAGWATRGRRLAALAAGGALGASLSYGWWGWHLQAVHGNPFFPYFNDIFRSDAAMAVSHADLRFRPPTAFDAALAPFRLLRGSTLFSELRMRDPRLLLGIAGFAWLAVRTGASRPGVRTRMQAMFLFAAVGTITWAAQSGIYRYATPLEAVGALAVVLVAQRARRWQAGVLLLVVFLVSADTRRPHWGRAAASAPLDTMQAPPLGAGALVVTATGDPLAYLGLGLPADVPLVALGNNFMQPARCTTLQQRASGRVLRQHGPLWLLEDPAGDIAGARSLLAADYGLAAGACVPFTNPLAPARLCRLARTGPARAPCLLSDGTRSDARR
jgi:hypothetical protein